jgi:hypothetical protein
MGVFDTFITQQTCEECSQTFEVDIQTHDLDSCSRTWREWDYIGQDYSGSFTGDKTPCPLCGHVNPATIVKLFKGFVVPYDWPMINIHDTYSVVLFLEEAAKINNRKLRRVTNNIWRALRTMEDWGKKSGNEAAIWLRDFHFKNNDLGILEEDTPEEAISKMRTWLADKL